MTSRGWASWLVLGGWMAQMGIDVCTAGALPAPPRERPVLHEVSLHLELVLNGRSTGTIAPVRRNEDRLWVQVRYLRAIGVPVAGVDLDWIQPAELSGVTASEGSDGLSLQLHVPAAWLPVQSVDSDLRDTWVPARSSFGMLANYDAYATQGAAGSTASVWTELRAFGKFGLVASTGVWRDADGATEFVRYDTQWRLSDPERVLSYEAGDLVSRGVAWSRPVRMAGVQVFRDFSIRPDVVTYPLPVFAGEAVLPSMVELFIDGYRAAGQPLDPGPFEFGGMPGLSGAGEATVITTDALGRQVAVNMPFYVANDLLAKGLTDFAVAAGWMRRDYGLSNAAYGDPVASLSLRHGASDWLTLEGHAEAADDLGMAGVGFALRLGRFGVLDAAHAHSRWHARGGTQQSLGYQYRQRGFGVQVAHTRRSAGYADLGVLDRERSAGGRTTVASLSLAFRDSGSAGVGYFDAEDRQGQRTRVLNLSWSQPLSSRSSLFFTLNRDIDTRAWSFGSQIVVPLGRHTESFNAGIDYSDESGSAQRVQYGRGLPSDGGVGWNVAYARGQNRGDLLQADVSWRGRHLQVQGGLYGRPSDPVYWGGASGSAVVMGGKTFLAPRINDAFAIIDTQGHAGVPVRYENQLVGVTDADGFLLVPWASAYYPARYEVDLLKLPHELQADEIEQRVAIARGSGYRIAFPIRQVVPLRLILHDASGQPVPVGARLTFADGGESLVGWDGLVYLENPPARLRFAVQLPGGEVCHVLFDVPQPQPTRTIGPLTCQ